MQLIRKVVVDFANAVKKHFEEQGSVEFIEDIVNHALGLIRQHPTPFDEADYILRETLHEYYLNRGQYCEAAAALSCIKFDSTSYQLDDQRKANKYVVIAGENFGIMHIKRTEQL